MEMGDYRLEFDCDFGPYSYLPPQKLRWLLDTTFFWCGARHVDAPNEESLKTVCDPEINKGKNENKASQDRP